MARYVASVDTRWDREVAFDYLAEFSNIADWDPAVPRATASAGDPLAVGARFDVDFKSLGSERTLVYETVEIERPRRVVLRAEEPTFVSVDVMTFDLKPGGGTIVTYDADVKLKGPLALFELPFRMIFRRLGDNARDGLRRKLAEVQPGGARSEAP